MAVGYTSTAQALNAIVELAYGRTSGQTYQQAAQQEGLDRCKALAQMEAGDIHGFLYLSKMLGLSLFEQHCFRLALAVEVDSQLEGVYAQMQDGVLRLPSLKLCLTTFTQDVEEQTQLLTQWRLRREVLTLLFTQGLGQVGMQSDLTVGLKVAPQLVNFCFDPTKPSQTMATMAQLYFPHPPVELVVHQAIEEKLVGFLQQQATPYLVHLQGEKGVGKQYLAQAVSGKLDRILQVFDMDSLSQQGDWEETVNQLCREVVLCDGLVALRYGDGEDVQNHTGRLPGLLWKLSPYCPVVFLLTEQDLPIIEQAYERLSIPLNVPGSVERMALMAHYFRDIPMAQDISFASIGSKFTLTPGQIAKAAQAARLHLRWEGEQVVCNETMHRVCRDQLAHGMGKLATRVAGLYTWEDLILPPNQKRQLQSACAQVEHRHQVYANWGFDKKRAYGKGLSMLFTGPPGTGKTMAAQVVANGLHLDLYQVEVSSVLSKYIGETEKQLGKVFDEVKKSQSILFFDEADALFGKRSETKDAHDKYANVQTAYLLQKMEEYDGIVVLASNYLENFDEAFKRRITYIIDFTLPDVAHRLQIWQSVLPPELPLDADMDVEFLARSFELSGSSIKNIALSAAFMAADSGGKLSMTQVLLALRAEQQKGGKTLHRDDFGEYYPQIEPYL